MPLRVGRLPTNHAQRVKEVTSTAANDCCWRCWMPHRDPFLPVKPTPGHGQVSNADLPFEIPTEPYRQPSPGATWVKMDSITCAQYATPN